MCAWTSKQFKQRVIKFLRTTVHGNTLEGEERTQTATNLDSEDAKSKTKQSTFCTTLWTIRADSKIRNKDPLNDYSTMGTLWTAKWWQQLSRGRRRRLRTKQLATDLWRTIQSIQNDDSLMRTKGVLNSRLHYSRKGTVSGRRGAKPNGTNSRERRGAEAEQRTSGNNNLLSWTPVVMSTRWRGQPCRQ